MELIQPPTDNLYKFGAIAGLVLFALGWILPPRSYQPMEEAFLAFEQAWEESELEKENWVSRSMGFDEVEASREAITTESGGEASHFTSAADERRAYLDYFADMDEWFLRHIHLGVPEFEEQFSKEAVRENFKLRRGWSEEQLDAYIAAKAYLAENQVVIQEAKQLRVKFMAVRRKLERAWYLQDVHTDDFGWIRLMCRGGMLLVFACFPLWYWKVQRIHDKMLRVDLDLKLAQGRSGVGEPPE